MADTDPTSRADAGRVVLLVAHGSRNPSAAVEHERLCTLVEQRTVEMGGAPVPVRPAYLEISTPSITEAIEQAIAAGATRITLLPHFLSSGNHVLVDLPAIASAAQGQHPGVWIELAEHLGADPGLVDLLARRTSA